MPLRSYSAEPVQRYQWIEDEDMVVPETGYNFTLGVFKARSVKLQGASLILEGDRATLVRDEHKDRLVQMGEVAMKLEIDLRNVPATVSSTIPEKMLFFEDTETAIKALPMPFAKYLPASTTGLPGENCKCLWVARDDEWIKIDPKDPQFVVPKRKPHPLNMPPPPDGGIRPEILGKALVEVYVNYKGTVQAVWLARPVGFGVDDRVLEVAQQVGSEPPTYHGEPVGFVVLFEVDTRHF